MTDQELLQLLAEKSPRELTTDEIAELQARARFSPEIRAALHDLVDFESQLTAAAGTDRISVDHILGRAEERRRSGRSSLSRRWWGLIGLTAGLLLSLGLWRWVNPQAPIELADHDAAVALPEDNPVSADSAAVTPDPAVAQPAATAPGGLVEQALAEAGRVSPNMTTPDQTPAGTAATSITPNPIPQVLGPWESWLEGKRAPLAADDRQTLGDLTSMGLDRITKTDFESWWMTAPGQSLAVQQENPARIPVVSVEGTARLRAPWLDDTRLRFASFDDRDLTFFFWQGEQGVALRHFRDREPHTWAAFQVHRAADVIEPPERWGLLTTDSGALYRSGAQVWDMAISQGQLQLGSGELVLLSVPYAGLPEAVELQGKIRCRGFQWVRAEPRTLEVEKERANILTTESPADWDWQLPADGSMMLQRDADGSVTLTCSSKTETARAFVVLPHNGLYEVQMQVGTAEPGTGCYLGDETGQPLGQLFFQRDPRTDRLAYAALRPSDRQEQAEYFFRDGPPPYFVNGQWLRLTAGLGCWHTACSADGQHFGYVRDNPLRDVRGKVRCLGLFCTASETPRTIRLQAGRVHRLDGVYQLAQDAAEPVPGPPNLADGKPDEGKLSELKLADLRWDGSWWTAVWSHLPGGEQVSEWFDRVAITTLEQGPPRDLADQLVIRLCRSAEQRLAPAARCEFFDDLLLLSDHRTEERSRGWAQAYARLAAEGVGPHDFNGMQAWQRWIAAPGCAFRGHREDFQASVAGDLLTATVEQNWEGVLQTAAPLQAWLAIAHPEQSPRDQMEVAARIARWSKATALERLGRAVGGVDDVMPAEWRHPWSITVNKEAYNVHAELQAALDNRAFDDAARIVGSLQPQAMQGLLPLASDPQLSVSLSVALQLAVQAVPEFQQQLIDDLTATAGLRVKSAMASGDPAAVWSATLQAWGTAPAAVAHQWLGDRALSLGDPLSAVVRYRAADLWADAELTAAVRPRLQLAEGLAGLPRSATISREPANSPEAGSDSTSASSPPNADPATPSPANASAAKTAAGMMVSPREVEQALQRAGTGRESWSDPTHARPSVVHRLQPHRYDWESLGRFDGQAGQNAGRGEYRYGDAFGRQMAVARDQDRVYLSNRFQVNAIDRRSGQRIWARGLGSEQGEAHAFPFVAMQPVVVDDRLYLRSIAKPGVELACLQTSDGKVLWSTKAGEKSHVLTDPVVVGPFVWSMVSRLEDQEQLQLEWVQFSRETGTLVKSTPLLRVRDAWNGQLPVTLAVSGLRLVAAFPGAVIGFDLEGQIHWARRETWLPSAINPLIENSLLTPPEILGDRVLVACPFGRNVSSVSLETGQQFWSTAIPELQGIVATDDSVIIAATVNRLLALDVETGREIWQQPVERFLGPVALNNSTLVVARQLTRTGERGWLQFTELDRQSGTVLREMPCLQAEREDWRFGPWWHVDDEIWALAAQGWRDPQREIVRLKAVPDTETTAWSDPSFRFWQMETGLPLQRELQLALPGWLPFGVTPDRVRWTGDDVRGERSVVLVRADAQQPVRWVRSIPPNVKSLSLRIGTEPNSTARWQVLVDGRSLWEEVSPVDAPAWRTVEVPLPTAMEPSTKEPAVVEPANGERAVVEPRAAVPRVVQVVVTSANDQPLTSCWKWLRLVFE